LAEIQSLARGLKILELLAAAEDGAGNAEIAAELGVDKGSASRLVQTLAKYGYAERNEDTRRYHLGPQVVRLSRSLITRMPLRHQARPFLHQLVERTGECAHLAILAQGQALYLDQEESPATLRVSTEVGTMAPLHCTALGKVFLAFGKAPMPAELKAYTLRTLTSSEQLRVHLEQVARQGYASDDEEYEYGIRCIAAPVYDYRNKVVAALGVSGPAARMGLERIPALAEVVKEVVQGLSNALSFKRS
jgi:IclR family transcriptional regulator, KDG regulon repressor